MVPRLARERYATPSQRFDARVRLTSWLMGMLGFQAVDVVILNDVPPEVGRRIVRQGQQLC